VEIVSSNNINREVLRNNLIHSLLNIYKYNLSYKNELLPIFELQKIYQADKKGIKNITLLTPGTVVFDKINNSKIVYNINGLKSVVDQIVSIFNVKVSYKPDVNKYFYDNECAEIIYKHEIIGYIGAIKKTLLNEYGINENIYAVTLN
jgi:phenylalanyl-tRNA synthetase beta chain